MTDTIEITDQNYADGAALLGCEKNVLRTIATVDGLTTVDELQTLIKRAKTENMVPFLIAKDWAHFAWCYKGPDFAKDHYDHTYMWTYNTLTGILQCGSKGPVVKKIQKILGLEPTGEYGPETTQAVREFQTNNRINVTGIADIVTQQRLGLGI